MSPVVTAYGVLAIAIALEVVGTSFLQKSEQFSRLIPTLIMAACYLGAFYFLSLALKVIPLGLAYAIWSGIGIILISALGYIMFHQSLDVPAIIGISLIISGVVIINVFSTSITHSPAQ